MQKIIVADTSVIIALLANEKDRSSILPKIDGHELVCSQSIEPELGNAISKMFKQKRITLEQGKQIVEAFQQLKIRMIPINLHRILEISQKYNIYAYDAYVLECAEHLNAPLITLDDQMKEIANKLNILILEV